MGQDIDDDMLELGMAHVAERLEKAMRENEQLTRYLGQHTFALLSAEDAQKALQARLDAVMLEYCPDEMTEEKLAAWGAAQRPAGSSDGMTLAELYDDLRGKAKRLHDALSVFAHPDLYVSAPGITLHDDYVILKRGDAVLTVADFKRAAAAIGC